MEQAKIEIIEKDPLEQLFEEEPEIKEIIKAEEKEAEIIKYEQENPRPTYKEFMEKGEELHKKKVDKPNIQKTTLKWNNRIYNVQVWNDRVKTMQELGYSETRILDLLAIMNMEC